MLAGQGYIVASISSNGIAAGSSNTAGDLGMTARAELIQEHLDIWKQLNTTANGIVQVGDFALDTGFGNRFQNKVDFSKIGTIGHSRGGEGVIRHAQEPSAGVRAVLAIAPTDYNRFEINDVPMGVILPYCDGDVIDLPGVHYFDDTRYTPGDTGAKYTFLFMGANHNYFNRVWTDGETIDGRSTKFMGGKDDWRKDNHVLNPNNDSHCGYKEGVLVRSRLSSSDQRDSLAITASGFFNAYLKADSQALGMLNGTIPLPQIPGDVHISYQPPDDSKRLDVNRLLEASNLTSNTLGGTVSQTGLTIDLCGGEDPQPQHCLPYADTVFGAQGTDRQPHTAPTDDIKAPPIDGAPPTYLDKRGLSQLQLSWDRKTNNPAPTFKNDLPQKYQDISGFNFLQFRASVNFDNPLNDPVKSSFQNFSVVLTDTKGKTVSVPVSQYSGALFYPPGDAVQVQVQDSSDPPKDIPMWSAVPRIVLNTIRIPLDDFVKGGIDLKKVESIQFVFDKTSSGALLMSDIALVKLRIPSTSPTPVAVDIDVKPEWGACSTLNVSAVSAMAWPSGVGNIQIIDTQTRGIIRNITVEDYKEGETLELFDVVPGQAVDYEIVAYHASGYPIGKKYPVKFQNVCPGNSTPDETHSASSYTLHLDLSELSGARPAPRVAVLSSGFFWATQDLAQQAGEPTQWIGPDFDPAATAAQYPVLLIPSGGLYGMESSTSFRARLEEYARLGGVIIAFDQQHGYEYAALPGGQVGGYGWVEDMACTGASLMMTSWHPALSGFDRSSVYAHVDGYFTSWPEGTQTLLSRSANGRPGAILYPFGEGWVFATTLYDDWGLGNGQSYDDARVLLRDLITWAVSPDDMPQYAPGASVALDVPVTNTGTAAATSVTLRLVDPSRQVSRTDTIPITIEAGSTASVPFTTTAATPLGVWRVDAVLLDDIGSQVATSDQAAVYAVARPPAMVDPAGPLSLSITTPDDTFAYGSTAQFTYRVYNHGDTPLTVTVHYGYNHDFDWYGNYRVLAENVVVPAAQDGVPGELTLPHDVVIGSSFRLRGHVTSGTYEAYADYGVWAGNASLVVDATLDPDEIKPTATVSPTTTLTATLKPAWSWAVPVDAVVSIRATDAAGFLYYNYTSEDPVPISGSLTSPTVITHPIPVPAGTKPGTGLVWISIKTLDGRTMGGSAARLTLPASPLVLAFIPPSPLEGDTTASLGVTVTNEGSDLPVESGELTLTLTTPDSGVTPTASTTFTAPPASTQTITVPLALPALRYGQYTLRADSEDEYSTRYTKVTWSTQPQLQGKLDSPTYRAGQTASLELTLVNPGPFVLPLTATAAADLSYTQTETLTLQPYATLTHTFSIPIPADVEAGSYPITLTLTLPSGDVLTQVVGTLQVPPSSLACTFDPPAETHPGDTLTATITNLGGARTWGSYQLELHDAAWNLVQSGTGELSILAPDATQSMSINVPQGVVSGRYYFTCRSDDAQTGEPRATGWPVPIAGVEALLNAETDREVYSVDEMITVTADVNNTGAVLPDGRLDLRITQRQDSVWPAWQIYNRNNSNLSSNWATSVAVDNVGNVWNVWIGDYNYNQPRRINMLSANSMTWTVYTLPVDSPYDSVNAIAIDVYNRKWMATNDGAVRLSADNESWANYRTSDGLASDRVSSIAVDDEGNVWFGTEAGASKLTNDGQWTTYNYSNTSGGLASDWIYVVAVDDDDNAWFGTDAGLSKLTPAGDWTTYTVENSGLLANNIYDIAFDEAGDVWLATPDPYNDDSTDGGVSVLLADGSWRTYRPGNSELTSENVMTLAMDFEGRVWIGHNGYGVDVILPDGLTWLHYDGGGTGVLSSSLINDIAASPNGDVWLATEPLSDGSYGGVTRAYSAGSGQEVLWTDSVTTSLGSPDTFNASRSVDAASLGATGKLYLEAELTSPTGQHVAYDEQPFYVFPPGVALTLEADTRLCRPGQPIQVTGMLENTGDAPLTGRTLAILQDGNSIYSAGPFDLAPGEQRSFSVTANAPASTSMTLFTASIDVEDVQVTEIVEVGLPIVTEDAAEMSDVVGSDPFVLPILLTNTGPLDAAVDVEITTSDSQIPRSDSFTVPAGQVYRLEEVYQISQDTDFTFTFSGDFSKTLEHSVAFGEALEAEFSPDALYPEGLIAIPYTLTNTGQLPVLATADVQVQSAAGTFPEHITVYLPPTGTAHGNLLLDLPAGDYTLTYTTPFGDGTEAFSVIPVEAATLSATAGPVEDSVITLSAQLANTGFAPIDGVLHVETPFFSADHPVSLATGGTQTADLPIDLSLAEAGATTATVRLLSSSGLLLASDDVSIDVPGPDLTLTDIPTDTVVTAGEIVTLTFGVANNGSAPAMVEISATLGDLLDEAGSVWLPGGESDQIVFSFQAPEGLTGERLTGEFWFEGQRYDLSLPIAGLNLDVSAAWDQAVYNSGDSATLSMTVANQTEIPTPPLYAHVSYNGEFFTQPLTLAANATQVLEFPLTVDANADPKVFYAIYETAEQRGVYLNTTYLYLRNGDVTIVPDRSVYLPGETVHATVYTTLTGALTVKAPGLDTTLNLAGHDLDFQFVLPADLLRGTYAIDYALGEAVFSTPFDVDATWVRVTEARLLDTPYAPGDHVRADLTVASTAALDVGVRAWLLYPDGTQGEVNTSTVSLSDILNNHVPLDVTLTTDQAGPHRLVYLLTDPGNPDRVYAAGSETFDVGTAQVLGLHTDRSSYPLDTDPVTATVTLYAQEADNAHLDLLLDGLSVTSRDIALVTGVQTVSIPVPAPISPAEHVLVARLTVGGLEHSASASFAYGTDVVDLLAGSPRIVGADGGTRTVRAYIYNVGDTASVKSIVQIWDGVPDDGGTLIGAQTLPALAPGTNVQIEMPWNVLGQAGLHTLTILADPENEVAEFNEQNNRATKEVSIPDFDLEIESNALSYDEGEQALITLIATNLTQSTGNLVITTTAETEEAQVVFTDARALNVPAASQVSQTITWDTAQVANQVYTIRSRSAAGLGSNVLSLMVNNVAPLVEAGPDQAISVGGTATFTGSFTDPGLADTHTIAWDFGDGMTAGDTLSPSHTYADSDVYMVTLTVTDNDGGMDSDTLTITVSNIAPVVNAGEDTTIAEGDVFSGSGSFIDSGADVWTATVDYDDGAGVQPLTLTGKTFDLAHTYADSGTYTVEVCVTDDDGGSGCDSLTVTASNVAPVVDAGPDRAADEGTAVIMVGSFTDPGTLDTHTIVWNFGDGTTASGTLSPSHTYADNGVYTVTLTITDNDGGVGSDTLNVTVSNAIPVVYFSGPDTTEVGTPVTFEGFFADLGSSDTHTIAWDFGDGSTLTGTLTATHTFSTPGIYTVTLTVTDDDGGVGEWEATVQVEASGLVVNSTGDGADNNTTDGVCNDGTGACTLRAAIQQANAATGTDTITFNIPGSGPYVIQTTSALPGISAPVVIDGTTQPGYAGTPIVRLDGANAGADAHGLTIWADSSTVRGLMVVSFSKTGILIYGDNNTVTGCYIGTDGTADLGNGEDGITIQNASGNTIGGTGPGAGNLISGNNYGIEINESGASGNLVQGNLIGTDATGILALGNTNAGISFWQAPNNIIGGTTAGAGNLISGNVVGIGIYDAGSTGNSILGNKIGTTISGTSALPNTWTGINVNNAPGNTIGGTLAGAGNLISGNSYGIVIFGSGATANLVQGNKIGTDPTGTLALGNTSDGISIYDGAQGNTIGGTAVGAGNLVSGNGDNGISIVGVTATSNTVQSNKVGTDITGTLPLGNTWEGILIDGATGNTISGNLTSGNHTGIYLYGEDANGNTVEDNKVGVDATGMLALGNTSDGIVVDRALDNTLSGNLVSANGDDGVDMRNGATGNVITGNKIGTNAAGTSALGNTWEGIWIDGAPGNTIGGTEEGTGNLISGNGWDGIGFSGSDAGSNLVIGNRIGSDVTGMLALGNTQAGIAFYDAPNNTIGGAVSGAGNLISANGDSGIVIYGNGSTGNVMLGNRIGTNADGTVALGNAMLGIYIADGAANNTVGGTAAGAGNLVSGNSGDGVCMGSGSSGNTVQGNRIGTTANGTAALGNSWDGICIYESGGNVIGGTAAGASNLISGNGNNGIGIQNSSATGNIVLGNIIGTDATGEIDLGNTLAGIKIYGAPENTIGGTEPGAGNLISGNADGILIHGEGAIGNTVRGNRIDGNDDLGIDLGNDGVTANDSGDEDGAGWSNERQNYPVLAAATSDASSTTIEGTLNSTSSTAFWLDFYASPACDASGYGEGKTYLGSGQVTTNASGNTSFLISLSVTAPEGWAITATATDPAGNTSEFSACVTASTITPGGSCQLYPIAIHTDTLASAVVGQQLPDVYNGTGPGNFGWLSWTGSQSTSSLTYSLTPPGDSSTYINPNDTSDHILSVGDWVRGQPGVSNASSIRDALDALKAVTIIIPVWDLATGQGANLRYHVVGFALIRITDYHLPGQNRISAIFQGYAACQP